MSVAGGPPQPRMARIRPPWGGRILPEPQPLGAVAERRRVGPSESRTATVPRTGIREKSTGAAAGQFVVKKLSIHSADRVVEGANVDTSLPLWLNETLLFLGMNASMPTAASSAMETSAAARYRVSP